MNKVFIFDWSGTLMNNFDNFYRVNRRIFEDFGKEPLSVEEVRKNFTIPYMKFWNRYLPELTKEEQDKRYEKYMREEPEPVVYGGAVPVILDLKEKGHKLFVVSSDYASKIFPEIDSAGLNNVFEDVISGVHDKIEALQKIVKNFSLNVKSTYYVGDLIGDVEMGKAAGLITVGAGWGFQDRDVLAAAKPDYLLDDIQELSKI